MENNNIFSNSETVAELSAAVNAESKKPKKPLPPLAIVGIILAVIALGTGLYFLLRSRASSEADLVPAPEIVYTTPEGSEDPEEDYLNYLDKQKSSAKSSSEQLSLTLDAFNMKLMLKKYDEAQEILDAIDESAYSSPSELYQLYSAYARLYDTSALDNATLFAEYTAKADEQHKILTGEQ